VKLFLVTEDGHKIRVNGPLKLLGFDDNDLTQDDCDTRSRHLLNIAVEKGTVDGRVSSGPTSVSCASKGYVLFLDIKPGVVDASRG
jgi:hypothetical protein